MHPGSPSHPSGTAAAEAKPRCVYSILKPHGQSSRCQVRLLPPRRSRGAYTQFQNHMVRVLSPLQSRSKAVVCVSTPMKYPRSGYFLVFTKAKIFSFYFSCEQGRKKCLESIRLEEGRNEEFEQYVHRALDKIKVESRSRDSSPVKAGLAFSRLKSWYNSFRILSK